MKFKEFLKKAGGFCLDVIRKVNKKAVVAAGAVLILGIAVLLNFLLVPEKTTDKKEGIDVAIDLSDVSATLEEKEKEEVSADGEDTFSQMALSREKARGEALEVLNSVAKSSTAVDSMKEEALSELKQIAADMESEANIESLVVAKGFEECVAVINGETASIVVKTDGLLATEVAQISEIVYEQAGIHPDNLNIIEAE